MASDDAAMDVEQNEEGLEQTEEKQEELDPIAKLEAKLRRVNELIETSEEELSDKVFVADITKQTRVLTTSKQMHAR